MDDPVTSRAVERLQAARERASPMETEHALARLESLLFGAPERKPMLARYTLVRRIGSGGSGVVWLAHDPRLDREVAIKLLDGAGGFELGTQGRARLLREAQVLARSPHPNIVAVYDVGTFATADGTGAFVVMEYVEGMDLRCWLETPRPWPEALDVFLAAGRGLAAAHAVGVVHRDFKPANAIVGEKGRVRVLDFGLARGIDRTASSVPSQPGEDGDIEIDTPLTVEGTVLGTPTYMAPEQHGGASPDPRSDQFALCVSLWEAIYRVRPFVGGSLDELWRAKLHTRPTPPAGTAAPRWLAVVLQRGLAPDPARRWPSIDAMLAAIAARRGAGARRARKLAMVAVLGVGGLASWSMIGGDRSRCTGAEARFAAAWDEHARGQTEAAFAATGLSYAASSFQRVDEHLHGFGARWVAEHRAACEATQATPELLDQRMACLDRELHEVVAHIELLRTADAGVVEHAAQVSSQLPDPHACEGVDSRLAAPADSALASRVEAVRAGFARVQALDAAGRIPEASALATGLAEEAEALGFSPLLAEALLWRGTLEDHVGRYDEAARTITSAHELAIECGHDRVAARAAKDMVFVEGERRGQLAEALRWAQLADAELRRAGAPELRVGLIAAVGAAHRVAGQLADAERETRAALELYAPNAAPDDPMLGMLENNLGDILRERGELDEGRARLEHAREIWSRAYGADHPQTAMVINNLAGADLDAGDTVRAEARYREALEIRERAFGPEHPVIATTLSNLGIALRRNGDLAEARAVYRRALSILRARFGEQDARQVGVLNSLALVDAAEGNFVDARAVLEQALAIAEATVPADHPSLAPLLQNHAEVAARLGDGVTAARSFARTLEIKRASWGAGHGRVARARLDFAVALAEAGAQTQAREQVTLALAELAPDTEPELRAELQRWLAAPVERYPGSDGR